MRRANYTTPLYPQKLTLTSPTSRGRSVGIVRSRTQATEFSLVLIVTTAWSPRVADSFIFTFYFRFYRHLCNERQTILNYIIHALNEETRMCIH
jgi:hypothetical protein